MTSPSTRTGNDRCLWILKTYLLWCIVQPHPVRLDPLTVAISSGRIVGCVIAAGALNPVGVFDEAVAQDRGGHTQVVVWIQRLPG